MINTALPQETGVCRKNYNAQFDSLLHLMHTAGTTSNNYSKHIEQMPGSNTYSRWNSPSHRNSICRPPYKSCIYCSSSWQRPLSVLLDYLSPMPDFQCYCSTSAAAIIFSTRVSRSSQGITASIPCSNNAAFVSYAASACMKHPLNPNFSS